MSGCLMTSLFVAVHVATLCRNIPILLMQSSRLAAEISSGECTVENGHVPPSRDGKSCSVLERCSCVHLTRGVL